MSLNKLECWYKSGMSSVNSDTLYTKGNQSASVYRHSTFCMDHFCRIPVCIYFLRNKRVHCWHSASETIAWLGTTAPSAFEILRVKLVPVISTHPQDIVCIFYDTLKKLTLHLTENCRENITCMQYGQTTISKQPLLCELSGFCLV